MRYNSFRAALPLALTFLCAHCAGASASLRLDGEATSKPNDGYVDAGGGVRLFYRVVGSGRDTVVVLHGGPGFTMDYLASDLEPLAARHVLLFYDQRGTGKSTLVSDSTALDAQRFAEDLEAVRKHFDLERLTLLGHSWGAGVAAVYASRFPARIGRLLIVDAIPVTRGYYSRIFEILDARRDSGTRSRIERLRAARLERPGDAAACRAYYSVWFVAAFADSAALRRSRGDFCAGAPEALVNKVKNVDRFTVCSLGDWDWRQPLKAVTAPALVIHGAQEFIPLESAREWTASLPNGRLLLLDGASHFPYLEVPEQFFAAVSAFLEGHWPKAATRVSR